DREPPAGLARRADLEQMATNAIADRDVNQAVVLDGRSDRDAPFAGRFPQHAPVFGRDTGDNARGLLDVLPNATYLRDDQRRILRLVARPLLALPQRLAGVLVKSKHHAVGPARRDDDSIAVDQRRLR